MRSINIHTYRKYTKWKWILDLGRSLFHPPIPPSPSPIPRGRWLQPDIRSYGVALRACQTSQQWQQALLLLWRAKKRCYNWCWDGFDMVWVCWGWFKSDFMHISIIIYLDPPFVPTKTVYFYLILDILVPSSSILQGMNFGGSRSW